MTRPLLPKSSSFLKLCSSAWLERSAYQRSFLLASSSPIRGEKVALMATDFLESSICPVMAGFPLIQRIVITEGRDIELNPRQEGDPLTFFIYPYAEADGAIVEDIRSHVSFEDLGEAP